MSPVQKQHVAQTVTGFFEHDRPVVIALMALCLVAMILIARRTKDALPLLIVAVGVSVILVMPHIPGSPIACLAVKGGACNKGHEETWLFGLVFILPLGVAALFGNRGRSKSR